MYTYTEDAWVPGEEAMRRVLADNGLEAGSRDAHALLCDLFLGTAESGLERFFEEAPVGGYAAEELAHMVERVASVVNSAVEHLARTAPAGGADAVVYATLGGLLEEILDAEACATPEGLRACLARVQQRAREARESLGRHTAAKDNKPGL